MAYTHLLVDLDHTLLDSHTSEIEAYRHTMAAVELTDASDHFDRYVEINQAMWAAVERGEIDPTEVRTRRFERFIAEVGIDADVEMMATTFVAGLGAYGDLYPGARQVLDTLAAHTTLAMITNGLSDVQRARIERLDLASYFDTIVISSEVGATKPRPEIFDIAFERLGHPDHVDTLMVGDSLTSDIRGGSDYGVATCWYNPHRETPRPGDVITHEITTLDQLVGIAVGS